MRQSNFEDMEDRSVAFMVYELPETLLIEEGSWYLDFGETCHMTPHKHMFSEYQKMNEQRLIYMGDDTPTEATRIGCMPFTLEGGGRGCIRNVLHVPNLRSHRR